MHISKKLHLCREYTWLDILSWPNLKKVRYTRGWNVWVGWFLAGNQDNRQKFDPSLLTNKLWHVFMVIKQKKIKIADSKKLRFSKSPNLKKKLWKFNGLFLGLVALIDAKGLTYMVVRLSKVSSKTGKKCIFCISRLFLCLCRTA